MSDVTDALRAYQKIATPPRIRHNRAWARAWATFPRMVDVLPEGARGTARIRHCTPTRAQIHAAWIEKMERWTRDPYAQLEIGDVGWMYDTFEERLWNLEAVDGATGDVLVGGLGLGMILHPILAKPDVRSVTVLESSPDVIALVAPSLRAVPGSAKLTILPADAFVWEPDDGRCFDWIWLDFIVSYSWHIRFITVAERLMRRYRPFLTPDGKIGHWAFFPVLDGLLAGREIPRLRLKRLGLECRVDYAVDFESFDAIIDSIGVSNSPAAEDDWRALEARLGIAVGSERNRP